MNLSQKKRGLDVHRLRRKLLEALVGIPKEDRNRIMRGAEPKGDYSFRQIAVIKAYRERIRRARAAF